MKNFWRKIFPNGNRIFYAGTEALYIRFPRNAILASEGKPIERGKGRTITFYCYDEIVCKREK